MNRKERETRQMEIKDNKGKKREQETEGKEREEKKKGGERWEKTGLETE